MRTTPGATGWTDLSALPGEPAARVGHAALAVASEFSGLWVWGGRLADGSLTNGGGFLADFGGLSWLTLPLANAPVAREDHTAVWARPWVFAFGGRDATGVLGSGGRYSLDGNAWQPVAALGAPAPRAGHVSVFAPDVGSIVWGGELAGATLTRSGGRYDGFTDSWLGLSEANAPSARTGAKAVWTGTQMLVWGGRGLGGVLGDGGAYDPLADSWAALPTSGGPSPREGHAMVWAGSRLLVWGGRDGAGTPLGDGASFDPVAGSWTPLPLANAPSARFGHLATWEDGQLLVATGETATGVTGSGKLYR